MRDILESMAARVDPLKAEKNDLEAKIGQLEAENSHKEGMIEELEEELTIDQLDQLKKIPECPVNILYTFRQIPSMLFFSGLL